jgi:hypothetical protein
MCQVRRTFTPTLCSGGDQVRRTYFCCLQHHRNGKAIVALAADGLNGGYHDP